MKPAHIKRHSAFKSLMQKPLALIAATAVFATTAGIAGLSSANAAPINVSAASARITIDTTSTGSGHGTSAQTWITTANGFAIGDDSPSDNVVSTNDTVNFDVDVQLEPGPARTVQLRFIEDDYFKSADTVTRSWTVADGAVRTIHYSTAVVAKDTQGKVVENVSPKLGVYVDDTLVDTLNADPVTIVSAPFADLVITGGGFSASSSRTIAITPIALKPAVAASNKGVSLGGPWEADVDVSDAPEDSSWKLSSQMANGNWSDPSDVTPVNGIIHVSADGGKGVRLEWRDRSLGNSYLGQFDVGFTMVPGSLSVPGGLQVNGDGTQPGDGLTKDQTTAKVKPGSQRGVTYPNNDWTFIHKNENVAPSGKVFDLQHGAPDSGKSIFDSSSLVGPIVYPRGIVGSPTGPSRALIAPATEGSVRLRSKLQNLPFKSNASRHTSIVGVVINRELERFHHTGYIPTPKLKDLDIDPSFYTIQWTDKVGMTGTELVTLNSDDWHDGMPDENSTAARVILKSEAIDTYGVGEFTADFGVRVLDEADLIASAVPESTPVGRAGFSRYTRSQSDTPGGDDMWASGYNIYSSLKYTEFRESILTVNPHSATQWAPGTRKTVQFNIGAYGITEDAELEPRLEVTYPTCVSTPKLYGSGSYGTDMWDLQIVPPVPGDTGAICGDPTATPGKAILTLKEGKKWIAGEHNYYREGSRVRTNTYPTLEVNVLSTSPGVTQTFSANLSWMQDSPSIPSLSGGSAAITIPALTDSTVSLKYEPKINLGDEPKWSTFIVSTNGSSLGGNVDNIIILPFENDGSLVDGIDNLASYTGARESVFTTRPTLKSVSFESDNTTTGTVGYFTNNPNPTFDADDSTWYRIDEAGTGAVPALSTATALRTTAPSTLGRPTTIQFDITMNAPTDALIDDAYVAWVGPTHVEGSEDIRRPWPAGVTVVQSEIKGEIFWDNNGNSVKDDGEGPIANVPVGLYRQTGYDTYESEPYKTATTDENGEFSFHAPSESWAVVSLRGDAVTTQTDIWGNVHVPKVTYNSHPLYVPDGEPLKSDVMYNVSPPVGGTTRVRLGYQPSQLDATLKSSPITSNCLEVDPGEECEATWKVQVHNTGIAPISGQIVTRTSDMAVEHAALEAKSSSWTQIVEVSYPIEGKFILDATGKVWVYGTSAYRFGAIDPVLGGSSGMLMSPVKVPDLSSYKVKELIPSKNSGQGLLFLDENDHLFKYTDSGVDPLGIDADGNQIAFKSVEIVHYGYIIGIGLDDTVYSWQNSSNGYARYYLGREVDEDHPELLTAALPVIKDDGEILKAKSVANGSSNTVFAITLDGKVYSWGGSGDDILLHKPVENDWEIGDFYNRRIVPQIVQGLPEGVKFKEVHAASLFTNGNGFFITDEDDVLWTWGNPGDTYYSDIATEIPAELLPRKVLDYNGDEIVVSEVIKTNDTKEAIDRRDLYIQTKDYRIIRLVPDRYAAPLGYTTERVFEGTPFETFSKIIYAQFSNGTLEDIFATDASGQLIWANNDSYTSLNYFENLYDYDERPRDGEVISVDLGEKAAGARFVQGGFGYSGGPAAAMIDENGLLYHLGMRQMGFYSREPIVQFSTEETDAKTDSIEATRTIVSNGFRSSSYPVKSILPGSSATLEITATIVKPLDEDVLQDQINFLAQSWWDGPETRISSMLPGFMVTPEEPADPGTELRFEGIPGNPTCSTILDEPRPEDTCDQVGSAVARATSAPVITANTDNGIVGKPLPISALSVGVPDADLVITGLPEGVTYSTSTTTGVTVATFDGSPEPGTEGWHKVTFTSTNTRGTDIVERNVHVADPDAKLTIDGIEPGLRKLLPNTVVDLDGTEFSPNAEVRITDKSGNLVRVVISDDNGNVDGGSVELVQDGEYWFNFYDVVLDTTVETNRAIVETPVVPEPVTPDPTDNPTDSPTEEPTIDPTDNPTEEPVDTPTDNPTDDPSDEPTDEPEKKDIPQTGGNIGLIGLAFGVTLAGAALLFVANKRRRLEN